MGSSSQKRSKALSQHDAWSAESQREKEVTSKRNKRLHSARQYFSVAPALGSCISQSMFMPHCCEHQTRNVPSGRRSDSRYSPVKPRKQKLRPGCAEPQTLG